MKFYLLSLFFCVAAAFEKQPAENLNILPNDIASYMKECALSASWYTANARYGYSNDAAADLVRYDQHATEFADLSVDLLSDDVTTDIAEMFMSSAWAAANERVGYDGDAAADRERMGEWLALIKASGQMTDDLAQEIFEMGWSAAWYAANARWGYSDAVNDEARMNAHYDNIRGQYNLIAMNFFPEHAVLVKEQKTLVAQQNLVNSVANDQMMIFSFEVTQGTTSETSHSFHFDMDIGAEIKARFLIFFKVTFGVEFGIGAELGWAKSLSKGTTKTYTFPLTVPAGETYKAEASIQEGTMEVPYEVVFLCDGQENKLRGLWKGVAVSTATYEVTECGVRGC